MHVLGIKKIHASFKLQAFLLRVFLNTAINSFVRFTDISSDQRWLGISVEPVPNVLVSVKLLLRSYVGDSLLDLFVGSVTLMLVVRCDSVFVVSVVGAVKFAVWYGSRLDFAPDSSVMLIAVAGR